MPLLSKYVYVKITSNMCKYYKEKGYKFKCNDVIKIDIEDLPLQSNQNVLVKCENCGKEYNMPYYTYYKCNGDVYCYDCKYIKTKKTNIKKYGCENAFQNKKVQEKQKNTVKEKYGCDNVFQNEDIKEKAKLTFIEKYGVEHPMKNHKFSETVIKKVLSSKSTNNSQIYSKQQKYLCDLFEGELNKLYENLWLDIYFEKYNIYCEYNGSGHDINVKYKKITQEEFDEKEIKRYKFLKSKGLKQMVISSNKDLLPNDDILLSIKDFAFTVLNSDYSNWIVFDIDNNLIKFKNNTINYNYNTLLLFNFNNNLIVTTKEQNILIKKDENIV